MRKQGGIMGGEIIVMLSLGLLAIYGVYKYMDSETNSYQQLVDKVNEMQSEMHSMADMMTENSKKIQSQQAEINNLVKKNYEMDQAWSQADAEIEKAQDHMSRLSKSVNKIDHMPRMVELVIDQDKPIPIKVLKSPVRKKKTITKKTTVRTKSGTKSISESNTVPLKGDVTSFRKVKKKRVRKKKAIPRKMPGARASKKAMREAGL